MNQFPVFIDDKESSVSIENQSLTVRHSDQPKQNIPFSLVSQVVIYGKAQIASDVWRHLAEHHIPAIILPGRGRGEPAFLGAGLGNSTALRLQQYNAFQNPQLREEYSLKLIYQKLLNQQQTLHHLGIDELPETLSDQLMPLDKLMGIEGTLARHYFARLEGYLDPKWEFHGRNRQPPKDPFNALISLSYMLLASVMQQSIERSGLDVWLGIFHQPYPGRPSLALDLMEPLRPVMDFWVIDLLESHFNEQDFTLSERDGCRMSKEARKIYYHEWANFSAEITPNQSLRQACYAYVSDFINYLKSPHPMRVEPQELQAPF